MSFFDPPEEYKPTKAEIWIGNKLKNAFNGALAAVGIYPVYTMMDPLKKAIEADDAKVIDEIFKKCPKAGRGELDDLTREPLRYALVNEKYAAARAILAGDRTVLSQRDYFGATALIDLAGSMTGDDAKTERILTVLLEMGANIGDQNGEGKTALHYAAERPTPAIAEFLVKNGAAIDARDKWQGTPLFSAAEYGKTKNALMLVDHGADINAQTEHGLTPATSAILSHYFDLARALMERGGKVDFASDQLDEALKSAKAEKNHAFLAAVKAQRESWEEDQRTAATDRAVDVIEGGLQEPVQVHAIHLNKAPARPKA